MEFADHTIVLFSNYLKTLLLFSSISGICALLKNLRSHDYTEVAPEDSSAGMKAFGGFCLYAFLKGGGRGNYVYGS